MTVKNWRSAAPCYGLDLSGGTTHTAAEVQAWLDAAVTEGVAAYAEGTLKCSGMVTIRGDCDLHLLTLIYTGTSGVALQVGDPAQRMFRRSLLLPQVVAGAKTALGWGQVAGTVGVQLANVYSCTGGIAMARVTGFETGLLFTGVPIGAAIQGTGYITVFPGHLDNNKVNFKVAPFVGTTQADSGWANQVTVLGGRLSHNSSEGTQVAGAKQIEIANCPNVVNGWTFLGTSIESNNVVESHIDTYGLDCSWFGTRFENPGGDAARKVISRGTAKGNYISRGYNAGRITQVLFDTALPFDVDTDVQMARRGGTDTVPTVLLENMSSSAAPVLSIMGAGAAAAGSDPATAWAVKATAQQWAGKRPTDANARLIMDYLNGRMYVGNATSAPVAFLGGTASAMLVGGGVSLVPLADAAQDLGTSGLKWRDVRLSRGLGVHGVTPPTARPEVTGSRSDGTALASLLTALASYGLITDSTTA